MADTTKSPGPFAVKKEDVGVPPAVEKMAADLYREAYIAGWVKFSFAAQTTGSPEAQAILAGKLPEAPSTDTFEGGYKDHFEVAFRNAFLDAFYEGWAASAATYIRDKRQKI